MIGYCYKIIIGPENHKKKTTRGSNCQELKQSTLTYFLLIKTLPHADGAILGHYTKWK